MLPGPKIIFEMSKKIKKFCLYVLSHIQMLPANFEAKRLSILACAKKQIEHQMLFQICLFHPRNTAAPFRMKIVKHPCNTNTNIHWNFRFFLKTFTFFSRYCSPRSMCSWEPNWISTFNVYNINIHVCQALTIAILQKALLLKELTSICFYTLEA
mgnify:CR=1 FL=1